MTMKPAARIAAFKFSVSAKSAVALRNSKKVLIRLLDLGVGVISHVAILPDVGYVRVGTSRRSDEQLGASPACLHIGRLTRPPDRTARKSPTEAGLSEERPGRASGEAGGGGELAMSNKLGQKLGPRRGNRHRFPYEPRVVGGKLFMSAELQAIHR
jgi:hypothetical protein